MIMLARLVGCVFPQQLVYRYAEVISNAFELIRRGR